MREVRPLTAEERTALNRMRRQEVGRVSLRAPRRRRSDTPWTVPPIAALLERSRGTVRAGIERCERWGPAGLDDEERRGRPRKINRAVEGPLTRWMAADPPRGQGRVRAPFGTIPRLVLALRPRLAMPLKPAPPTREKPWALVQAVVEAGPEAGVRAAHASRGPTRPGLRARWPWVGPPLRGPTPGANTARAIVGAVHIRTGQWSDLVRAHRRTEDGRAVREHRLVVSPPQPILVRGWRRGVTSPLGCRGIGCPNLVRIFLRSPPSGGTCTPRAQPIGCGGPSRLSCARWRLAWHVCLLSQPWSGRQPLHRETNFLRPT